MHQTWQFYHFNYKDLYTASGLGQIDRHFLDDLKLKNPELYEKLTAYRNEKSQGSDSLFLIELACHLQAYIITGFDITKHHEQVKNKYLSLDGLKDIAKTWLQTVKFAERKFAEKMESFELGVDDLVSEQVFLRKAKNALDGQLSDIEYDDFMCMSIWAMHNAKSLGWAHYLLPQKRDYENLIDLEKTSDGAISTQINIREGFAHQDKSMTEEQVHYQVHYCIYCHKNQGDFCRRGFPVKKKQPELGFKLNPSGELLSGCPLDERISEMHYLRAQGDLMAAFAMITRDNPMVCVTGHRICNDCMKACIYQKQDPVDIPEIESHILKDVLALPWGVELYQLMIWWNPLRQAHYVMSPPKKQAVAIMGMGPAGFTMAQQLLLRGYQVTGFDGLSIRKFNDEAVNQPVYQFEQIKTPMDQRMPGGFGGVAEYGITARWEKNYLDLMHLILLRQERFNVVGGIRFGGTLTIDNMWDMGFSHCVLAVGAGLPSAINIPNSLAPGMRQANDFLMNLQLSGAHKKNHKVALDVNCPAVVIGGGLTGVDTATEVKAYYLKQIKEYANGYAGLDHAHREEFDQKLSPAERKMSKKWLADANKLETSDKSSYPATVNEVAQVSIAYRRRIQDAPAYRKNPEELASAMTEGLIYKQESQPERVTLDENGHVSGLVLSTPEGDEHLEVNNIFVATGARPNIAYSYEHRDEFERDNAYYHRYTWDGGQLVLDDKENNMKSENIGFLTSYNKDHHFVSLVGDAHPVFHGSVVGAIASSIKAAEVLDEILPLSKNKGDISKIAEPELIACQKIDGYWQLTIQSPLHAHNAKPGHLYRLLLLNECKSPLICSLAAQSGNTLTFFIPQEKITAVMVGDPVSLMGPSGVRMRIDEEGRQTLISDREGFVDLISIYNAHRYIGTDVQWLHDGDISEYKTLIESYDLEVSSMDIEDLKTIDSRRMIVMGSAALVKQISQVRNLLPKMEIVASVKGPAQCMLKGICAQCFQWQVDPVTLKRTKAVFACSWQNEPIELIDVDHLQSRNEQTKLWEKFSEFVS